MVKADLGFPERPRPFTGRSTRSTLICWPAAAIAPTVPNMEKRLPPRTCCAGAGC
jgi:hypothetical protein